MYGKIIQKWIRTIKAILRSAGGRKSVSIRIKNTGKDKLTAGGLEEISYVTRLIPSTSLVIREEMRRSTSGGKRYLEATIRNTHQSDHPACEI